MTDTYINGCHPADKGILNATIEAHALPSGRDLLRKQYREQFRQAWDDAKQAGEHEIKLEGIARRAANVWLMAQLNITAMITKDRNGNPL